MSLLLGVRGPSSQKTEQNPIRESLIQQPGSLYSGSSSSPVWGNPLGSPLWCANVCPPLSTTIGETPISSFLSNSVDFETSNEIKPVDSVREPSHTSYVAQNHSYPGERQTKKEEEVYNTCQIPFSSESNSYVDEDGNSFQFGANTGNRRSMTRGSEKYTNKVFSSASDGETRYLDSAISLQHYGFYNGLDFNGLVTNPSAIALGGKESMVKNNISVSISDVVDKKIQHISPQAVNHGSTASEAYPKPVSDLKETAGIFIFGATGSSTSTVKPSSLQQKMFQTSSVLLSSSKTRGKSKRHSNVVKGNTVSFGTGGSGLSHSTLRNDVSSLESLQNSDAGPFEGSSHDRDDEANIPEPAISLNIGGAHKETWQPENLSDSLDVELLDQNQENIKEQGIVSDGDERKHVNEMEDMEGHFSSWFPFHGKSNEEPRQRSDHPSLNAWSFLTKGIFFSKTKEPLERGQQDPASVLTKDNRKEFLNQNNETENTYDPSVGPSFLRETSSDTDLARKTSNIGECDFAKGKGQDHFWNIGGKALPANYVFGSFQNPKVQGELQSGVLPYSKTHNIIEGLGGGMQKSKNEGSNLTYNPLSTNSSSTPSCNVKNFSTAAQYEPVDQYLLHSAFSNGQCYSPNSNIDCPQEETQLPTGEFSGPVSSSESSESELPSSSLNQDSAGDKMFNVPQYFEFQGNLKNTDFGLTMERINTSSSLNSRRHQKGSNRHKKNIHKLVGMHSSLKQNTFRLHFSPSADISMPTHGIMDSEQFLVNLENSNEHWPEFKMEDMDNESLQVPITAAENQNLSEESSEWVDLNFSSKRSENWKRAMFEEAQKKASLPNSTIESQLDTDKSFASEEGIQVISGTFDANYHAPAYPADSDGQHLVSRTVDDSLPINMFDKNGLFKSSGVNISMSNQYFSDKISTEKSQSATSMVMNSESSAGSLESSIAVISAAAEQTCEQWRLRGNQAYANGDFPKAEEYYSRGASSISPSETSQSCIRALMLCYSNRAATRMAVGRMREALADCKRAMVVDSGFLRVRLRAASCHLALGESRAAAVLFSECLKHAKDDSKPDAKILGQAMEGLKKSQQLDDYSERATQLFLKESVTDSSAALRLVNEAMSISPYSESLYELKAQVLLSLGRYEEVIQLCEQSLPAAERNHGVTVNDHLHDNNSSGVTANSDNLHLKVWRWQLSAKGLYYLGKLEEALDLLTMHDAAASRNPAEKSLNTFSSATLFASIRDLLRHKAAGNEAFQLGKHAEAVEHYTAALACNGESRPFNAICFCNRAAASQALGCIADAIADCSRAIALDSSYPKALSRRATLHEMIRDYGQACNDLRRLIALLEGNRKNGKNNQQEKASMVTTTAQDLKQAQDRLVKGEEEMKKRLPVDHYMLLGVDTSCSSSEIKKAYRKAALRHHPDKAGQFLTRENGDVGGLWKEVGDNVRADAERLFKLIGEAYGVLSDPDKKSKYDFDEEQRRMRSKDNGYQVQSGVAEGYRTQFEKSGRRQRDRWDVWGSYGHFQRWQSGPDAAQPDTFAGRSAYGGNAYKAGSTSSTQFSWDDL